MLRLVRFKPNKLWIGRIQLNRDATDVYNKTIAQTRYSALSANVTIVIEENLLGSKNVRVALCQFLKRCVVPAIKIYPKTASKICVSFVSK